MNTEFHQAYRAFIRAESLQAFNLIPESEFIAARTRYLVAKRNLEIRDDNAHQSRLDAITAHFE
jgi:hypothetical protein